MALTVWIFSAGNSVGNLLGKQNWENRFNPWWTPPSRHPSTTTPWETSQPPPPQCSCSQKPSWRVRRSLSWLNPRSRSHKHTTLGKQPGEVNINALTVVMKLNLLIFSNKNVLFFDPEAGTTQTTASWQSSSQILFHLCSLMHQRKQ